jgi:uncharacterized repeat protein (TIGR01451 family)
MDSIRTKKDGENSPELSHEVIREAQKRTSKRNAVLPVTKEPGCICAVVSYGSLVPRPKTMKTPLTSIRVLSLAAALFTACSVHAAPLITSLVETGGDGPPTAQWTGNTFTGPAINTYTVPLFNLLAKSFCDRVHAWTNASATVPLPPYLVNNPYIMIRNDNRENAGYRLDVTVSEDVLVYLLIDNRNGDTVNGDPPFSPNPVTAWTAMQWVGASGFRPVTTAQNRTGDINRPDEISIDESADGTRNQYFSIYSNRFPAGTFSLLQQGFANNMYGVVLVGVGPTAPPAAPTNVVAAGMDSQVTVSWTATQGASGYNIKRSSTSGGPYTTVGSTASTTFTDPGLQNGSVYYYVVSGTNVLGEGVNSIEVVGAPNPIVTGITAVGGTNEVMLTWNDLDVAESYIVLRATVAAGPYTNIASGLVTTSYTDTSVEAGKTYYYMVSAPLVGGGTSGQSAAVSAVTAPSAPAVTLTLWGTNAFVVRWTTATNASVTGFNVERSTDGTTFELVATAAAAQRAFTNIDLAAGTTYFYRVQAMNASGFSAYSAVVSNSTPLYGWAVNFGTGSNNSAGNPVSPVPPGYANDIGEVFMLQADGLVYGWTNAAGTNITRDARYRQNVNSPDLRYDTLNHMQKSPGGAGWEIDVPNGYYRVRVVGGDPTAVDSTFQYNIEGTETVTYVPVTGAWWADFTTNAAVSDGRLSVWSGSRAANNKINFIEIFPDVPVGPSFVAEPQTQSVTEWTRFSISATVVGSPLLQYQWYFNDAPLPNATNSVLDFGRVREANEGSYYLVVTNYGGAITSGVSVLTVNPDTQPPQIASVSSLDGWQIGVTFNEDIDTNATVVTETFYYLVNAGGVDVEVGQVLIRPDGRSVVLKLNAPVAISGTFTVDAANIPDYANNIDDSTIGTGVVLGYTAQDIGAVGVAGSHFTSDGSSIEIVGSGTDIWGAADQGYMATKTVSGDFDVRIRVDSLTRPDNITKAVVVARETTSTDSRAIHVSLNPPNGRNQTEMGLRSVIAGTTASIGTPYVGSNSWIRISRLGDTFTGYRSIDGLNWSIIGATNVVFPASMEVGFGITAHTNTLLATGIVSNVRIDQSFVDLQLGLTAAPADTVAVGNNVTYTIGVFNAGAAPAVGAVITDVLPAGMTFVSATSSSGSCSNVGGTVTCNVGTIIPSGQASVTIVATATTAGLATNRASIASSILDTDPSNNSNIVVVNVTSGPVQQPITGFGFQTGGTSFGGSIQTQPGVTYQVQYKDDLNAATWTLLQTIDGDGAVKPFSDPAPTASSRFYRIIIVP